MPLPVASPKHLLPAGRRALTGCTDFLSRWTGPSELSSGRRMGTGLAKARLLGLCSQGCHLGTPGTTSPALLPGHPAAEPQLGHAVSGDAAGAPRGGPRRAGASRGRRGAGGVRARALGALRDGARAAGRAPRGRCSRRERGAGAGAARWAPCSSYKRDRHQPHVLRTTGIGALVAGVRGRAPRVRHCVKLALRHLSKQPRQPFGEVSIMPTLWMKKRKPRDLSSSSNVTQPGSGDVGTGILGRVTPEAEVFSG